MYLGPRHELSKMDSWLQNEIAKKHPEKDRRDFENWMKDEMKQKERKREIKRIAGSEKPRSFNYYYDTLRAERKQQQYEDEDYEIEQARNEQKWLQRRNMQYKSGARFSQDTTSVLDAHVSDLQDTGRAIIQHGRSLQAKANDLQQLWASEGQGSAYS